LRIVLYTENPGCDEIQINVYSTKKMLKSTDNHGLEVRVYEKEVRSFTSTKKSIKFKN
jgi:hypothetical protein